MYSTRAAVGCFVCIISISQLAVGQSTTGIWSTANSGKTGIVGGNTGDLFGDSTFAQSDRARAAILDSDASMGEDRDGDDQMLVGLESRQRVNVNATTANTGKARNPIGVIGDAVREDSSNFQTSDGSGVGVFGRAFSRSSSFDSTNYSSALTAMSKLTAVGGATAFVDPALDEPSLADGSSLSYGFASQIFGGEFNVIGDNRYFDGTSGHLTNYSANECFGAAGNFITGYFNNAPSSVHYGGHVLKNYNLYGSTILQSVQDKVDKNYGLFLKAPIKKTASGTNAEALASLPESYGVYIDAPSPATGVAGDFVTPSNYVGIQCNANAVFSGAETVSGVLTATNASNSLAGNGSGLTSLSGSNIASGTVADARLSAAAQDAISKRHSQNTDTGTNSTSFRINSDGQLFTTELILTGINDDAVISYGAHNLEISTDLDAQNIYATSFVGDGSGITGLDASNLASGTVPSGRVSGTYSNALTLSSTSNNLTASQTTTGKLTINGSSEKGQATVTSGSTSVSVSTTAIAATDVVMLTFPGNKNNASALFARNITAGTSFVIDTGTAVSASTTVNWRIVH